MKYIVKENKVVVKLYDKDKFKQSAIIPTSKYPLSSNDFRIFHSENTEKIEDKKILNIIDTVNFKMGHCYSMADELKRALKNYHVEIYAGWRITGDTIPVHHCWCVLDDRYMIDLSDMDDDLKYYIESHIGTFDKNIQLPKEFYVEYITQSMTLKNSIRISHIGKVSDGVLYVGSKDNPENAKQIYKKLTAKYPDHEIIRNKSGMGTPLQLAIKAKKQKT